jgi:hypothetical protein
MRETMLEVKPMRDYFPCDKCSSIKRIFCLIACREYTLVVENINNDYEVKEEVKE